MSNDAETRQPTFTEQALAAWQEQKRLDAQRAAEDAAAAAREEAERHANSLARLRALASKHLGRSDGEISWWPGPDDGDDPELEPRMTLDEMTCTARWRRHEGWGLYLVLTCPGCGAQELHGPIVSPWQAGQWIAAGRPIPWEHRCPRAAKPSEEPKPEPKPNPYWSNWVTVAHLEGEGGTTCVVMDPAFADGLKALGAAVRHLAEFIAKEGSKDAAPDA